MPPAGDRPLRNESGPICISPDNFPALLPRLAGVSSAFSQAVASKTCDRKHENAAKTSSAATHGAADESMAWFHVAREEAVASGALASELDATRNLVSVQMALGRHEEARELARAAERKAAESGERSWSIEFRTLEMLSRFYDHGDHDEALSWLSYVRTAPVRLETRALATAALATLLKTQGDRAAVTTEVAQRLAGKAA